MNALTKKVYIHHILNNNSGNKYTEQVLGQLPSENISAIAERIDAESKRIARIILGVIKTLS
jgi:hypothetical protein